MEGNDDSLLLISAHTEETTIDAISHVFVQHKSWEVEQTQDLCVLNLISLSLGGVTTVTKFYCSKLNKCG